jgi:Na+/H+-dicarboxylate symporter
MIDGVSSTIARGWRGRAAEGHGGGKSFFRKLYVQVLVAVVIGAALGALDPALGVMLQPLGGAFIKAIRAVVTPIIFTTVVVGIATIGDMLSRTRSSSSFALPRPRP